jgi:TetR/AcrR family transcriptional repressor of mexJK operon
MGRSPRVTRDQVLAAARETFVEHGFAGATLAEIGSRLSISPAALLRHAPTKEALFVASMGQPDPDLLPLEFLEEYDGSEDPRAVLRRVGEVFIPFLETRIRELVARWVYFQRASGASPNVKVVPGVGRIPLPFDPSQRPTPPQRNFRLLVDYFRRAGRRGQIRMKDPRAAALAFLATLHSYVFMQQVMQILEEPLPVGEYLDTVVDVWTRGIVAGDAGGQRADLKRAATKASASKGRQR